MAQIFGYRSHSSTWRPHPRMQDSPPSKALSRWKLTPADISTFVHSMPLLLLDLLPDSLWRKGAVFTAIWRKQTDVKQNAESRTAWESKWLFPEDVPSRIQGRLQAFWFTCCLIMTWRNLAVKDINLARWLEGGNVKIIVFLYNWLVLEIDLQPRMWSLKHTHKICAFSQKKTSGGSTFC